LRLPLLFGRQFAEYFAPAGPGQPLWLFVHVPKTAGSSLRAELAELLRPEANIHIDHGDTRKTHHERFDQAVADFIAKARQRHFRFASGHLDSAQASRICDALPEVRRVTMLRHPDARFVSDFRYQRSPMHPTHEEFRRRMPTLEDYVGFRTERNKTARHLVPRDLVDGGDAAACIDHVLQNFDFVGIQEMYPLSFRTLTTLVGEPRSATRTLRANEVTAENRVELAPAMAREIEANKPLDMAIYETMLQRFRAIRAPLRDYLRDNAPIRGAPIRGAAAK